MKEVSFGTIVLVFLIMLAGCTKESDRQVIYRISESASGFDVRYLNDAGEIISDKIITQSAEDVWNYSFTADDGGIVFVSANYKDPGSSIRVQILLDGKVYKQAVSKNDTVSFVTVSGVLPIRE